MRAGIDFGMYGEQMMTQACQSDANQNYVPGRNHLGWRITEYRNMDVRIELEEKYKFDDS